MVVYKCVCCNYTVSNKQAYERHLNSKKHAERSSTYVEHIKHGDINDFMEQVKARFDILSTKNIELETRNNELLARIEKLERDRFMPSSASNVHNGNGNNVIDNSNHYHIHLSLAKYGTESYPDDVKALTDAIKGVNKAIPSLVKLRHFDPRHPENQNIKIPNKKQNKIQVYDGKRWVTEDKRMTIEDKLQEYTNFMDTDEGQEIYNGCSLMIREKLDKLTNFCEKVHSGDKLNREDSRELKRITGDVENIILDHQKK